MTKSALVLRDLDLIRAINERSRFCLIVSLVHPDDQTRALFEPGAASAPERLEALRACREAGCATGVLAMPLLPGITDTEETVRALYDAFARIGVDFVQPGGLTLRPGRQKDFFLRRLHEARPDLRELYASLYAEERASGAPLASYTAQLSQRCLAENRRVGLPFLVPHHVYGRHLAAYDETSVLLRHMIELYDAAGIDIARLRRACDRYMSWLTERKRDYNRHRSWDYRELSEEVVAPGELERILGNEKLASFLRQVLGEEAVFDYVSLELARPTAGRRRADA
jgi:hypothetical protein